MTELDVLFRTVSSLSRLRILAYLLHLPTGAVGTPPSRMASALGLSRGLVSFHLKALLRARLVRYWKKERTKFYNLARTRRGSLRSRLLDAIRLELPEGYAERRLPERPTRDATPDQRLRFLEHAVPDRTPLESLWMAFTSFSHFRRLLLIAHLLRVGAAPVGELAGVMDLSERTTLYHVDKLERRKGLRSASRGLALAPQEEGLHRTLWGLVTRTLGDTPRPRGPA